MVFDLPYVSKPQRLQRIFTPNGPSGLEAI